MDRTMLTENVAARANVCIRTVHRWVAARILRPYRIRGSKRLVFDADEVEAALRPARATETKVVAS
jgi:predicted site-specific integrase-resolvase